MPVMLTKKEETEYALAPFNRFDPYKEYFVVRKETNPNKVGAIGEIKVIDDVNSEVFLSFLDSRKIHRLGSYSEVDKIIEKLMEEYDVIQITDEDITINYSNGTSEIDDTKRLYLRKEVIDNLFRMSKDRQVTD